MRSNANRVTLLVALIMSVGSAVPLCAMQPSPLPEGANGLFIGHSFFVPVAKSFDAIARQNDFPSHRADFHFAGGRKGAPAALWNSKRHRQAIEEKLATGKVELLGMTVGTLLVDPQDYQRWIDLALKHNPATRFFIGHCWVPGGPRLKTDVYRDAIEETADRLSAVVQKLRAANPSTPIYFVSYGKTASLLMEKFDAEQLSGVTKLFGKKDDALFRDRLMGHAGPMILDLSAMSWLNVLYGAEIATLKGVGYDAQDVADVTSQVLRYNREMQW